MTASDPQGQGVGKRAAATVLIVDDEAPARTLLRKTLEAMSVPCRIFEAADGETALEVARRSSPDLVLLDIVLPGSSTSGVLVCQELCKAHTKVLVVSGNATGSIAQACLSMGAADILRKPFSVQDARAMIESCLAS
ncbi:MAG TPA: response regulator [Armatimonadota bacterium]|nr:response regulator [Armatimonadota bacterium]